MLLNIQEVMHRYWKCLELQNNQLAVQSFLQLPDQEWDCRVFQNQYPLNEQVAVLRVLF